MNIYLDIYLFAPALNCITHMRTTTSMATARSAFQGQADQVLPHTHIRASTASNQTQAGLSVVIAAYSRAPAPSHSWRRGPAARCHLPHRSCGRVPCSCGPARGPARTTCQVWTHMQNPQQLITWSSWSAPTPCHHRNTKPDLTTVPKHKTGLATARGYASK